MRSLLRRQTIVVAGSFCPGWPPLKYRDTIFQIGAVWLQHRVGDEGERFVREATWRGIEYVYADAMSVLVRRGDRVGKSPLFRFSISVTKVTGSRRRQLDPRETKGGGAVREAWLSPRWRRACVGHVHEARRVRWKAGRCHLGLASVTESQAASGELRRSRDCRGIAPDEWHAQNRVGDADV